MYSFMNLQYNMPQFLGIFGNNALMPNPFFGVYSNPISCFNAYPPVYNTPVFNFMPAAMPAPTTPNITVPNFNNTNSLFNVSLDNIFSQKPIVKPIKDRILNVDYSQQFLDATTLNGTGAVDLKYLGYNREKGQRLSQIAAKNAVGFTGYCARYTKNAIMEAGLGAYEPGHAYQCVEILKRNPNFKEILAAGLDLKKLPAGCILVYDRGVSGYNPKYGHIEITDGKGNAISDGITRNIRAGAHVFIPV